MPAPISPTTLEAPVEHVSFNSCDPVYLLRSDSAPFWTPGCIASRPSNPLDPGPSSAPLRSHGSIAFGPLNPHDPGPTAAAADQIRTPTHLAYSSITIDAAPVWTPSPIVSGPSNPYDPGPSAAVADHIISAFTHHAFPAITNYALFDFLRTPPRSPSLFQIVS